MTTHIVQNAKNITKKIYIVNEDRFSVLVLVPFQSYQPALTNQIEWIASVPKAIAKPSHNRKQGFSLFSQFKVSLRDG